MSPFTTLIILDRSPYPCFVIRRRETLEILSSSQFTSEQLERMFRYVVPQRKYAYLYSMAHKFYSVDEIAEYANH